MPKMTLYMIPLDPYIHEPTGACIDPSTSIITLTGISEGSLKLMPVGDEDDLKEFIKEVREQVARVKKSNTGIKTLVCVCALIEGLGDDGEGIARIMRVEGFNEEVAELRHLYYCIASIRQVKDEFL